MQHRANSLSACQASQIGRPTAHNVSDSVIVDQRIHKLGCSLTRNRSRPHTLSQSFRQIKMKSVHTIFLMCFILTGMMLVLPTYDVSSSSMSMHRLMLGVDAKTLMLDVRRTQKQHVLSGNASLDSSASPQDWSNPYNLIHVVTSRFMQHQANLTHLARARLELMRAITLPSLQQQSNQNFLWILRVDPHLAADILAALLNSTQSMSNLVIVLTNANPEGFRDIPLKHYQSLATPHRRALLESFRAAAQTRAVLETRLDADDGLALDFVEQLQRDAARRLAGLRDRWIVWCIGYHLEWQQYSPWPADAVGAVAGWSFSHCVTPGLTWGYPAGVSIGAGVVTSHHRIHRRIPKCSEDGDAGRWGNCLRRLESPQPRALRARTITSAGMANLVLSPQAEAAPPQLLHWRNQQKLLWRQVEDLFGVSSLRLKQVRQDLVDHLRDIATDALKGQCTAGHSCKRSSRELLQQILSSSMKKLEK